jgi:orotate phosphoribosyltransferase
VQVSDTRSLRRLLVSPHSGIIDRLLDILRDTGTLLEGHFELDPSRHTPYFVRFSEIGWKPRLVDEVATMLLEVAPFVSKPATIVCAETSAIFLAQALGRKTGNPVAVAAVDTARHPTSRLRTGTIDARSPMLVVSDVITTGRSLTPLLDLKESPDDITGIVSFAVLSTARFAEFARSRGVEAEWLLAATWDTNRPHPLDCSGCASRTPVLHASEFS